MEPVWLALAAPRVASAAVAVGRRAAEPFADALNAAQGLLGDKSESESESDEDPSDFSLKKSLHSQLLGKTVHDPVLSSEKGVIRIEDIRANADQLQASLQGRIHELMERSGIKLDGEVQLRVSPVDGQLEVEGDGPQRAILEAALASDPSIATDFQQLSAMRSLVNAADKHMAFAKAYARDPYQAVADHAELFSSGQQEMLLFTLTSDELSFEFR